MRKKAEERTFLSRLRTDELTVIIIAMHIITLSWWSVLASVRRI